MAVTFSVTMNWLRAFRPRLFEQLDGRVDLDLLEVPHFEPGPGEIAERRELADAVLGAIASLPPRYRLPLTMFHLDGLSYEKVAQFLDIPLGTAKSLIHRARAQLRQALGAVYAEEVTKEVLDEHRLPVEFAERVIGGLEQARWGAGERENSVIGALAAALDAMGEKTSYEELMGLSGAAFRIQMHRPRWCPSAPHASCGFDCHRAVLDALGYELVAVPVGEGDPDAVARARRAVMESIDRGVPAFYSSEEESLVVGYDHTGRQLLLRRYGAREKGYTPWWLEKPPDEETRSYPESFVHDWPFLGLGVLRPKPGKPGRREARKRSLELALELARSLSYGPYASGFAAYAFWIEGLRNPAHFADAKERLHRMGANARCYYSLYDARSAAAHYLRGLVAELADGAAPHLARAAELYREIAEDVLRRECSTGSRGGGERSRRGHAPRARPPVPGGHCVPPARGPRDRPGPAPDPGARPPPRTRLRELRRLRPGATRPLPAHGAAARAPRAGSRGGGHCVPRGSDHAARRRGDPAGSAARRDGDAAQAPGAGEGGDRLSGRHAAWRGSSSRWRRAWVSRGCWTRRSAPGSRWRSRATRCSRGIDGGARCRRARRGGISRAITSCSAPGAVPTSPGT